MDHRAVVVTAPNRYEVELNAPLVVDLSYDNGARETVQAVLYRVSQVAGRTALRIELRQVREIEGDYSSS